MARNRRPGDPVLLQANAAINYDGNNVATVRFKTPNDEVILVIGARYHPGAATYGGMLNLVRSFKIAGTTSVERILRAPGSVDGVPLPFLAASSQREFYASQRGYGSHVIWPGDATEMVRLLRAIAQASSRVGQIGQIGSDPNELAYRMEETVRGLNGTLGNSGFVCGGYSTGTIELELLDLTAGSDEIGTLELFGVSLGYKVPISASDGQHNAPFWVVQPATAFTDAYAPLSLEVPINFSGSQVDHLVHLATGALVHNGTAINDTTLNLIKLQKRNGQVGADFTFNGLSSVASFTGGVGAPLPRLFRDELFNGDNVGFQGEKAAGSGVGTLRLVQACMGYKPSWLATFVPQ